jgi:hypothetical protein
VAFGAGHGELAAQPPYFCNFQVQKCFAVEEKPQIIIQVLSCEYQFRCKLCAAQKSKYPEFVPARRVFYHGGGEVSILTAPLFRSHLGHMTII